MAVEPARTLSFPDFSALVQKIPGQHLDESLLLEALQRCNSARQAMLELTTSLPGVPDLVTLMIKEQWALDGNSAGLRCLHSDGSHSAFVSLSNAAAFVRQHPQLPLSLNSACLVVGIGDQHTLAELAPVPLLERLKQLDLEAFIQKHWSVYWNARAPGTAVSRQARANQLYKAHVQAVAQMAYAQGVLSAEQLKPLLPLLDQPPQPPDANSPARYCERISFRWSDGHQAPLHNAMVLTIDSEPLTPQLLYLPSEQPALQVFSQRSEMEHWLIAQQAQWLAPTRATQAFSIDYTSVIDPFVDATDAWLAHLPARQLTALGQGTGADFAVHGPNALAAVDQVCRQQRQQPVFSVPPTVEAPSAPHTDPEPEVFGLLHADIPLGRRTATLNAQHEALEALLGPAFTGDENAEPLKTLKATMTTLSATQASARQAVVALLGDQSPRQLFRLRSKPNAHYDKLFQARLEGLRAEATIQRSLKQISDEEFAMLEAVLDAPDRKDRSLPVAVMRIVLTQTLRQNGANLVQSQELNGPLVITRATAQQDPVVDQSLLLYWPGESGGLQRFASPQAMKSTLLRASQGDDSLSLLLTELPTQPFVYSLQNQLHDCEQKVADVMTRYPATTHKAQQVAALDALCEKTRASWLVPVHGARDLAYAQLMQQYRGLAAVTAQPAWLTTLPDTDLAELKVHIQQFAPAMQRAHALIERDLPAARHFSAQQVEARLRRDFSLTSAFVVTLDLPDSVTYEKHFQPGAAPGTPVKRVPIASQARRMLTLGELALFNIDSTLGDRLSFKRVDVICSDSDQRKRLLDGLTTSYLSTLVSDLDVAQKYEDRIRRTFVAGPGQRTFSDEYQHEVLLENWRLLLKLQGRCARLRGHIDDNALQILNIAIDANTPDDWRAGNRSIVLKPAHLAAGGTDTDEHRSTLLGVTFIEEQTSKITLLYLPDRADGQVLYQYSNLEQARTALFNASLRDEMAQYLAGRALSGNVQSHVARISQAHLRRFDAMIGVGPAWPAGTSLSQNLLNAHMGQWIEAHRATSRSNDALFIQTYAGKGSQVVFLIKLAMGLVPFVGTAIALYDAWESANLAAAAFLRGDTLEGVDNLQAVLLSLIDAAMDLATGISVQPNAARAATRQRQLLGLSRGAAGLHPPSLRKARAITERFTGYEYEQPISLHGLLPHSEGIYRNVYRHTQGDFIVSQGRIFQVHYDDTFSTLRLNATRTKTYKQPIALDDAGEWNTHGAVYGTLVNGGLPGGGGVLGHLADRVEPFWPQAIREWLPPWWTDRVLRQQLRRQDEAMALGTQVSDRTNRAQRLEVLYLNASPRNKATALSDLEQSLRETIDAAILHDGVREQLPRPADRQGINLHQGARQANAGIIVRCNIELAKYARLDIQALAEQFGAMTLESITPTNVINYLHRRKTISLKILSKIDELEHFADTANAWHQKIQNRREFQYTETDRTRLDGHLQSLSELSNNLAELNTHFGANYRSHLRFSFSLECFSRYDNINDASWFYLQQQTFARHIDMARTLRIHYTLGSTGASRLQRLTILERCILDYQTFSRDLKTWNLGYPQHFDQPRLSGLLNDLEKMIALANLDIGIRPTGPRDARLKVFTTEDNQLLIGTETTHPQTNARQFIIEKTDGQVETWNLDPQSSRARLDTPAQPAPVPEPAIARNTLVTEAQSRLNAVDAYQSKVQGYARQNTLPVDLEHMMISEAAELTVRANRIQRVAPDEAIIGYLRGKANELTATGRSLRIQQSMSSKTPTGGYLDYLLEPHPQDRKRYVRLRKIGERIANGRRQDGRPDYFQEYAVHDLTQSGEPVLWYVHAHYDSATTPLDSVVKAHLKLPEQRHLGLEWQKQQATHTPIWRGDFSRALLLKHFADL